MPASQFDVLRERVKHLINLTDLVLAEKEKMIDEAEELLGKLEISRQAYANIIYLDIVAHGLKER